MISQVKYYMKKPYQLQPFLPSICPQEPIILSKNQHPYLNPSGKDDYDALSEPKYEKIAKVTKVITRKALSQHITPKIIKKKMSVLESYENREHQRSLEKMNEKISGYKNWQHRKQDNNDPLAHPVYLIRNEEDARDANIEGFRQRVLGESKLIKKKRQQSEVNKQKENLPENSFINKIPSNQLSPQPISHGLQRKNNNSEVIQPTFRRKMKKMDEYSFLYLSKSKDKKSINQPAPLNLPKCTVQALLRHIQEFQIFINSDLKILRSRMQHAYNIKRVKYVWEKAMKKLKSQIY